MLQDTNYQIVQINGQRIYSPCTAAGIPKPPKGTEIFIGNLPPDVYEDEIIPLFSQKGPIYNVRLMMDFFGKNRGYAFVAYFRPEDAHAAVSAFNNYRLRNTTKIAVSMSVDNRRLFIGNVPRNLGIEEVRSILDKYVDGIVQVILYREPTNENLNRGFVFVEFESHRQAAIARRQLAPGNLNIGGESIFVDWAEPLPTVSPHIMNQVTKLYLSNLPCSMSTQHLKDVLCEVVNPIYIVKVHKMNDYAFVHFTLRKYAEDALRKLTGLVIANKQIEVEWARPIEYSKQNRAGKLTNNYCKSVPPAMRKLVQQSVKNRNNHRDCHCRSSLTAENSSTEDVSTDSPLETFQFNTPFSQGFSSILQRSKRF